MSFLSSRKEKRAYTLPIIFLLILSSFTQIAIGYSPSKLNSVTSESAENPVQRTAEGRLHNVTLVTGDSVLVRMTENGSILSIAVEPADPKSLGQNFVIKQIQNSTYVFPSSIDFQKYDLELFNINYLIEEGYEELPYIPILVEHHTKTEALMNQIEASGGRVTKRLSMVPVLVTRLPKGKARNLTGLFTVSEDIKKIWLDRKVSIRLYDSVPLIGAPELWEAGYNGSGIEVAILDTGIDDTHPDLDDLDDDPSTIDPKVIREIDFTDDYTTDDLAGHGTHCAGIVAGTGAASGGTYGGVAPGALLWNVKVLDEYGSGMISWIIAGIEYAAYGPDGNPNTGDEADIISMSLGGAPTDGLDPMSLAVDAAVDAGVVVVIAAGNDFDYFQIGSPGSARKVITVGASDKLDELAYFSSKGPTVDLRVKPDLLAPGVDITSSVPYDLYGSYYQPKSGTSMATPHVAGAAALMLQKGVPTGWTAPQYVKNTLISTAFDLGYDVYAQGGGRIFVPLAVSTEILVDPATVSFGQYLGESLTDTALTFYNLNSTSSHDLTLTVSVYDLFTGVPVDCASLNTTMLNIYPDSSASVLLTIDLTVPRSVYGGKVIVNVDTGETIQVIFGFARLNELTITKLDLAGAPAIDDTVDIIGAPGLPSWSYGYTDYDGSVTFYVSDGNYHVISTGDDWGASIYTIMENVSVTGDTVVHLDERDTIIIDFDMNKPDQIMAEKNFGLFYEDEQRGIWFSSLWWYPTSAITYVSPTSINTGFTYSYYPEAFINIEDIGIIDTPEWHKLFFTLESVTEDTTFIADYDSLTRRVTDYKVALTPDVATRVHHVFDPIEWGSHTFLFRMNAPQRRIEWLSPEPVRHFGWYSEWEYQSNERWFFSEQQRSYPTGEAYLALGEHPFTSGASLYVEPGYMDLFGSISADTFGNSFLNWTRYVSGNLTVILDGVEVYSTEIWDYFWEYVDFIGMPEVKIIIEGDCGLSLSTNTRTELEFVTDIMQDYRPPKVMMQVSGSDLNCSVQPGITSVEVTVLDESPISSVSLEYSNDDGLTWNPASMFQVEIDTWIAEFSTLSNTYPSLRVNATDSNGNKISQTTIRGFYVGWGEQLHDLHVSLEAPTYLPMGSSCLLNATVYNVGQENEVDVDLVLSINGTVVNSMVIPFLVSGTSQTINYLWIPPNEGNYNVTAFTPPVLGEEKITNNLVSRIVYVGEKTALISYMSELTDLIYILDSMGLVYDVYNNNYLNFYTEDSDLLLDYDTVIYYNRHGLTYTEYVALKSYLSSGGNLLVTGFDSLISDPLLAKLVCSSSTGDNMGEPDLYVVDSSHPIMDGPYGNFPEEYHITGLYSDNDAAEADTSRGAVTVAELADGYDKIIAAYQAPGKVVYWNGIGPYDWITNLDCENMFKNILRWFETRYVHELAVNLEVPLYLLPGEDSQLNLTLYNHGLDTEHDITVQLYLNGTTALEQSIPTLENGASTTLSYLWTPSPGRYNVTAYVEPKPDENYVINNRVSKWVDVSYSPTHVGDIIVEGDDIIIIEDIYFTQVGNIYVQDNAGLIIRNATLNMDQEDYRQYEFIVSDSAWLFTEDAYIVSKYRFDTRLVGNAEGWLNSTFFGYSWDHPPVASLGYIYVQNNVTMNIQGSTLNDIYCYDYSTVSFYVSDLSGIYCYDFSVVSVYDSDIKFSIYVSPWGGSDVLLQGCTVGSPRIGFSGSYFLSMESLLDPTKDALIHEDGFLEASTDEKEVHPHTLNEKTPDMMQSWLDPHWRERSLKEEYIQNATSDVTPGEYSSAVVTITDLHPGYIEFWNIHLNETVSGVNWNLTLVDTMVIDGWDLSCYGDSEVSVYDSSLRYLNSYDSSTVSIYDSVIKWNVNVSPWGSSDVYLEGCVLNELRIGFRDYSSAYLTGLHPRYIWVWNIHANETVSGVDWNLTLVETDVINGWSLSCNDYSEVSVFDSTLIVIDCQYRSVVSIYDSYVRYLYSYDYSLVSVYNSTVYAIGCRWFYGQLFFDETIVDGWWDIYDSQFYVEGSVNFAEVDLWFWDSEVTRNYGVEVTMNDYPAPGIALTLYVEGEIPIWSGLTDASGLSNFNKTLNDSNYATVYSLRTDDYPEERSVSFISETPILIQISSNIIITSIEDIYGNPISGGVRGDTVVVKGSGVTSGSVIELYWDTAVGTGAHLLNSTEGNPDGTYEIWFNVPEAVNGEHYLWVKNTDTSEYSSWGTFTVIPSITLDVEDGPVGTVVAVSGSGFTSSGAVTSITLDGIICGVTNVGDLNIDSNGAFTFEMIVPSVETLGINEMTVTDNGGLQANNDFLITGLAEIKIDPLYGVPGTNVSIHGYNFSALSGEEVVVKILDESGDILLAIFDTDANGEFSGFFIIPAIAFDDYRILAAQNLYNINATCDMKIGFIDILILPTRGPTGTQVQIWGIDFTPNGEWNATIGDTPIFTNEIVSSDGTIEGIFFVPTLDIGIYNVTVMDVETEREFITEFTVVPARVEIGVISSTTSQLETLISYYEEIIEPDINAYCAELGYDVRFDFLFEDAQGQAAIHLEKVQSFKAMGVNLIIGGRWSPQASGSLSYVNENNMLLFSPSSTSPILAIPGDNLYRMCPTDLVQAPAIAEMLWNWGIEAIIVIQRGDSWADGIYNSLEVEYTTRGGAILERIRYAPEVAEFSSYLVTAEEIALSAVEVYGSEHVGILMISYEEAVTIVTQAQDYPTLYSLYWFGSDGTALLQQMIDNAPVQANHIKIFSTLGAPDYSAEFYSLYDRYFDLTFQHLGYYQACDYDVAWVIAKAVLESQSTDAQDVIALLPTICGETHGVTGWCMLDENGDRYSSNYDIWGFGYVDDVCQNVKYGYYDSETGEVIWDTDALGFTPPGHVCAGVLVTGPWADELFFKIYLNPEMEYLALKTGDINIMDWELPAEKVDDALADPNIMTDSTADLGYYLFDINMQRWPTSDLHFRRALAHLVDKARIETDILMGFGYALDSPVPVVLGGWVNPDIRRYEYSTALAVAELDLGGFIDTDGDGFRNDPITGDNMAPVLFFIRLDDPERKQAGEWLAQELMDLGVPVEGEEAVERSVCADAVMNSPDGLWNVYTGGWGIGRDPDHLADLFHSREFDPDCIGGWRGYNYQGFVNSTFDYWADILKTTRTFEDVKEAAFMCQEIIAEQVAGIPIYGHIGVKAYSAEWTGLVNEDGQGINSWWSTFNMHPVGQDYGGIIEYGIRSVNETLNPMTAGWTYTWEVLDNIYESPYKWNPYDLSEDWGWLAESWEIEDWTSPTGVPGIKVTFNFVEDALWHDGVPFTAEDLKFTYEYISEQGIPRYISDIQFIEDLVLIDDYTLEVYQNTTSYFAFHYINIPILPKHIWENVGANWQDYDPVAEGTLIGLGPWKFVDYVPGEYVHLVANEDYWKFPDRTSVSIGSAVIAPGQSTEVPVNMSHATKIAGLGFELYWNPDVISITGIRLSDDLPPSTSLTVGIDPVLGKATVGLINTDDPDYLTFEEERPILIMEIEAIGLHGTSSLLDLEEVEVTDAETWLPSPVSNVEDGMVTIQNLGNIHGYVTYSCNGSKMEGATVELSRYGSTIDTTITGVDGEYEFIDILLGEYNLTASHERIWSNLQYTTFWNASASANVIPGETTEVIFSLLIRGDLNDNGRVDIGDIAKIANMYVGNLPKELDITDFNENGWLDIGDVAKLANYYVGNIDEV